MNKSKMMKMRREKNIDSHTFVLLLNLSCSTNIFVVKINNVILVSLRARLLFFSFTIFFGTIFSNACANKHNVLSRTCNMSTINEKFIFFFCVILYCYLSLRIINRHVTLFCLLRVCVREKKIVFFLSFLA